MEPYVYSTPAGPGRLGRMDRRRHRPRVHLAHGATPQLHLRIARGFAAPIDHPSPDAELATRVMLVSMR